MPLPLKPPIKPQLARAAKELPEGEKWRYEPKWDGFRTIVFRDGDDVYLQSRNGKPMNRYFPEIVPDILALPQERIVLDGELIVVVDGIQEFDLLGQRIHPAKSRVEMLATETPAAFVAFDLLAEGDEVLCDLSYLERRERLEAAISDPVQLTPVSDNAVDAGAAWLTGNSEGVIAKLAAADYRPGERTAMMKIKRVRTADTVVMAFRMGKEEGTVGSLILGLYDDEDQLHVVGHTSGFTAKQKRELPAFLAPYETGERFTGEPSRWNNQRELEGVILRPELVVEVTFDHTSNERIRHGAKILRWREDKDPKECTMEQLDQ
jgi:ATP-dependent DNA ligase